MQNIPVGNYKSFSEKYRLTAFLGRGSFGKTYYGKNTYNGKEIAAKFIDIELMGIQNKSEELYREVINLSRLSSPPNCSDYVSCYEEIYGFDVAFKNINQNGIEIEIPVEKKEARERGLKERPYFVLVMEYINGRNLYEFLSLYGGPVPAAQLYEIFRLLAQGLQYIHSRGIAHRDIKTDNIMITQSGYVKYIDFGLSCYRDSCKGYEGAFLYNPPEFNEVLFNKLNNVPVKKDDDFPAGLESAQAHDVYSLGVVFYVLAFQKDPYNSPIEPLFGKYPQDKYTGSIPGFTSSQFNQVIYSMINIDPKKRLKISQVVKLLAK